MTRTFRSDAAFAASILGLALLLVYMGNTLLDQWRRAEQHQQSFSFEHLLGFAATAAGVTLVAWWTLSLLLAICASLLHRSGRTRGANAVAKCSPAFMLRLAVALVSMNLLGASMAQAASATPSPAWDPAPATTGQSPHPAWTPTSLARATHVSQTPRADTSGSVMSDPRWQPLSPVIDPGLLSRPSSRQEATTYDTTVVVKDGDSLWSIAASRLAPFATDVEVALMWPKWYAANRGAIGDDPSVLTPGLVLRPPSPG
ncbi:hypothetical protein QF015_002041 [Paenarthrobacter sp. TE4293]|uniref:LysM peptidoglycan-binding domain-containing protein n=1 Tax=Paenarthrobacter sp. TE4293 TaxID=3381695 RepID=UPI003D19DB81